MAEFEALVEEVKAGIDNLAKTWEQNIIDAQGLSTYKLDGVEYPRIPHPYAVPCRDCAVVQLQLHVPGCCIERCPKCGGQAISCECCPY